MQLRTLSCSEVARAAASPAAAAPAATQAHTTLPRGQHLAGRAAAYAPSRHMALAQSRPLLAPSSLLSPSSSSSSLLLRRVQRPLHGEASRGGVAVRASLGGLDAAVPAMASLLQIAPAGLDADMPSAPLHMAYSDVMLAMLNPAYGETAAVLEASVLLLYLGALLVLLGFGSFLVVRQVIVKRDLENAAKELQERVRSGQASSEEYFELGAVMLRKKFYTMANKYLMQAISKWEGDEQELAQVHNALGFSYFSEEKYDKAIAEYEKAVGLQPAYTTAWNNLGDVFERQKEWAKALKAYENTLVYDPTNRVASERKESLKTRVESMSFR